MAHFAINLFFVVVGATGLAVIAVTLARAWWRA